MPEYLIGARAHDYGRGLPEEMLKRLAADGFSCTQLAYKKAIAGVDSYQDVTNELVCQTRQAMEITGVQVPVLGVYVELAAVDEELRRDHVEQFISQIPVCKALGASCMGSETTAMRKQPPGATVEDGQRQLLKSLDAILPVAEAYNVTVALEPVWHHALNTPETVRRVLDTMGSPNLKVLFDPANLMSREWMDRQDKLFGRAMELWGDKVMAVHFKGVCYTLDGRRTPCPLEQSAVDYREAFAAMKGLPQAVIPVIREEAVPARAALDIAFMRSFFR